MQIARAAEMPRAAPAETVGSPHEPGIARAIAALDFEAVSASFRQQGEFIFLEHFLPEELVAVMIAEARQLRPAVHRAYFPYIRKAGAIGHSSIASAAPALEALYRSPSFLDFSSRLCAAPLALKNDRDAHAAALYVYDREGDHVGFHYDDCGCEGSASYTASFGLINDTQSKVHFQLFRKDPGREMQELYVPMTPGSLVFFCGSRAYHRVTPLRRGEERVVYSFAHVREGRRLTGFWRLVENVKDAALYFGPRAIFQDNY